MIIESEKCDLSYGRIGSMSTVSAMLAIFFGRGNPRNVWQKNNRSASRRNITTSLVLFLTALLSPFTVAGQTQRYTVATGQYVLDLPSAEWRAITISVADHPRDFRFKDDNGVVRLRIRREIVKNEGVSTMDVAERQRRLDRSARLGYVTGTVESFKGAFSGTKYSYEYVSAGKPLATVIYYLRVTNRAIYRIEFNGSRKMLLDLAGQTESIARSFRLK
jgi:hypothetical protein